MANEYGGTYIAMTTMGNDDYALDIGCLEQLESAHEAFNHQVQPANTMAVDKVLQLPTLSGGCLTITISQVRYFMATTEEIRERVWRHNRMIANHKRAVDPEGA